MKINKRHLRPPPTPLAGGADSGGGVLQRWKREGVAYMYSKIESHGSLVYPVHSIFTRNTWTSSYSFSVFIFFKSDNNEYINKHKYIQSVHTTQTSTNKIYKQI